MDFDRLRKRRDFLQAAKGVRAGQAAVGVCALHRLDVKPNRLGLTVPRRCGNAVMRNRIKRRLRHAMRHEVCWPDKWPTQGCDIVVTARPKCASLTFHELCAILNRLLNSMAKKNARTRQNLRPLSPSRSAS